MYYYELLPHPPYSPDVASSHIYLFPLLKKHLHVRGSQYASDNDIIQSVEDFLEVQDGQFYQTGMVQKLQKRWNKCIEVKVIM